VKPSDVEILLLRPDEVRVDNEHATQRGFRLHHAKRIASDYSPALAALHVSKRPDGFYAIDGQHTVRAAIMAGMGNVPIPARIHRGLSLQEEAELFQELNKHKLGVSAYDRFVVGVTAGQETNLDIVRILKSFGLIFGQQNAEGTVCAVDALVRIYEGHVRTKAPKAGAAKVAPKLPKSQLLSRTLTILTKAWGKDKNAFEAILLKGIAALLYKHDTRVDGGRLSHLLAKSESPVRAIGKIRALSEAARITPSAAAVQYFEGVFNRKLAEEKKLK
jgi:Family of unknown function (DUF6551)